MKSWRDVYKVHPAADLFPMLPEDELRKLGEDIKANGLRSPIVLWAPSNNEDDKEFFVLDGRNRLDAMELVGLNIIDEKAKPRARLELLQVKKDGSPHEIIEYHYEFRKYRNVSLSSLEVSKPKIEPGLDPYAYVISKNIR